MIKNYLRAVLAAVAMLSSFFIGKTFTAEAETKLYTVYFYDTEFRNRTITVHVWDHYYDSGNEEEVDTDLFYSWDDRRAMMFTGKQIEIDGVKCPVYSLTFQTYYEEGEMRLLFNMEKADADNPAQKSADYVLTNGALYNIGGEKYWGGDTTFSLDDLEDYDRPEEKHTVYLAQDYLTDYNNYYGPWYDYNTKVHVWGPEGDHTTWAFNQTMHTIPLYARCKNCYVSLMAYEFWYFGGQPTGIIFHDSNRNTPDLEFIDGALYYFVDKKTVTEPIYPFEMLTEIPDVDSSFYVVDTNAWCTLDWYGDWENIQFEINGSQNNAWPYMADDWMDWSSQKALVKYVKIKGKWYPVMKYNTYMSGHQIPTTIVLGSGKPVMSGEIPYIADALYYYSGAGVSTEPITEYELFDEIPADELESRKEPVTVYLNLGANQIMQTALWNQPYCHAGSYEPSMYRYPVVYDNETEQEINKYSHTPPSIEKNILDGSADAGTKAIFLQQMEEEKMEEVSPGVWKYTIEDPTDINDITFYYYTPSTTAGHEDYMELGFHPVSYGRYNDMTEMTDFVFDIGTDCVHQSYLTIDEYTALKAQPIETVHLVGSWTENRSSDDPIRSYPLEADHGCFFHDFTVTEEAPASFKISTMDVPGIVDAKGRRSTYNFQRGWATYNLGIIGCHINPDAENYQEWYDQHVVRPETGVSREIRIKTNECLDYNGYTQYPWRVEVGTDHGVTEDGQYWMVLDLIEGTAVLLDFDPHPHVVANATDVRQVDIPVEKAESLHNGEYLSASETNGKVLFDKVNVAKGTVNVEGTGNDLIENEGFDVVYTVYTDEEKAFVHEGKPEVINADYLNLADNATIAVRGRFHDNKTGKYFNTRYSYGDIINDISEFNSPSFQVTKQYYGARKADENYEKPWIMVAGANLTYVHEGGEMIGYPDYEVNELKVEGTNSENGRVHLVHQNHQFIGDYNDNWYLGMDSETPWKPYVEGEDFSHESNWSKFIVEEGKMPLFFDNLLNFTLEEIPTITEAFASLKIATVYPFLVSRYGHTTNVEKSPRRANEEGDQVTDELPLNLDDYKLVKATAHGTADITFSNITISGVENVVADGMDVGNHEKEYYDLSGKRIYGEPVPGIYVVRQGTNTYKEIVR